MDNSFIIGTYFTGLTALINNEALKVVDKERSKRKTIVICLNGEYSRVAKNIGGEVVDFKETFINPCDIIDYTKDRETAFDFFISFVETVFERRCTVFQKNVIARACIETDCITLYDFYKQLLNQASEGSAEANQIALAIEQYATPHGMFNCFLHNTNVNPDNQLTVIDLSSFSERQKTVALQLSLMYAWSAMAKNNGNGIRTWVFLDEVQEYFRNETLADTFCDIYNHSDEQKSTVTGIAKNFHILLDNEMCRRILSI